MRTVKKQEENHGLHETKHVRQLNLYKDVIVVFIP